MVNSDVIFEIGILQVVLRELVTEVGLFLLAI
jgi:hypothetical protein